jgi:hypothetical protein
MRPTKTELLDMLQRMQEIHAKELKSDSDIEEFNRLHYRIDLELSERMYMSKDEFLYYQEIEAKACKGAAESLVAHGLPQWGANYAGTAARLKAKGRPAAEFVAQWDDLVENAEARKDWRRKMEVIAALLYVIDYWPWEERPWERD